jgi:hypothetical protein
MKKEKITHLHSMLVEIKKYIEKKNPDADFEEYSNLEVEPIRNDMSKEAHKEGIFVLGEEIADNLSEDEFSDIGRIRKRMEEHQEA